MEELCKLRGLWEEDLPQLKEPPLNRLRKKPGRPQGASGQRRPMHTTGGALPGIFRSLKCGLWKGSTTAWASRRRISNTGTRCPCARDIAERPSRVARSRGCRTVDFGRKLASGAHRIAVDFGRNAHGLWKETQLSEPRNFNVLVKLSRGLWTVTLVPRISNTLPSSLFLPKTTMTPLTRSVHNSAYGTGS